MSFFSLKKNKESYSLVLSINSGSVSGGVLKYTEKAGENIIYYTKEVIPFKEDLSTAVHHEAMKKSLNILIEKIQKEGVTALNSNLKKNIILSKVYCIFSSPWCASQTKIIRLKENRPFKVTDAYLEDVINENQSQVKKDLAMSGKVIEKKIIKLTTNGYVVNNFHNQLVRDLELAVFFTVVPEDVLSTIESSVSRTFHIDDVWCHSSSLSIYSVITDLFPQKEDFIHMDISEEITDISIIKDGVVISNASLPFARNDFVRELSTKLKVSEEVADSMIRMYCKNNNDELADMKLAVAMDEASRNWMAKISEVFNELRNTIYVPDTIFIVANEDISSFLKCKLEKDDFKVLMIDNRKIKPSIVKDDIMFRIELMFLDNIYKI